MAIYLNFRQVCEEVLEGVSHSSNEHSEKPSQILLGKMFRDVFVELVGNDPRWNWASALADEDFDLEAWQKALLDHIYVNLLAHRIQLQHEILSSQTEDVMDFWLAIKNLSVWLAESLWNAYQTQGFIPKQELLKQTELPVDFELAEPGWKDSVCLTDIDLAFWCSPNDSLWSVIELKFDHKPDAIGMQLFKASLYYLLLGKSSQLGSADGSLSLLTFTPRRENVRFEHVELVKVMKQVKGKIGQLASVLPSFSGNVQPINTQRATSSEHERIGNEIIAILKSYGVDVINLETCEEMEHSIVFSFRLTAGSKVAKIKQIVSVIFERLRLKKTPLVEVTGERLYLEIEKPSRGIVFYWPGLK